VGPRVQALGKVDEIDEIVGFLQITGCGLGRLDHFRILSKIWGKPKRAWYRGDLAPQPFGSETLDVVEQEIQTESLPEAIIPPFARR
jgi:hypothetical protein